MSREGEGGGRGENMRLIDHERARPVSIAWATLVFWRPVEGPAVDDMGRAGVGQRSS